MSHLFFSAILVGVRYTIIDFASYRLLITVFFRLFRKYIHDHRLRLLPTAHYRVLSIISKIHLQPQRNAANPSAVPSLLRPRLIFFLYHPLRSYAEPRPLCMYTSKYMETTGGRPLRMRYCCTREVAWGGGAIA